MNNVTFTKEQKQQLKTIVYKNSLNYIVDEHIVWIEF